MIHQGHKLASIDVETTGLVSGFHEMIQIAVVPLDDDLNPFGGRPFYTTMRPNYPERADPRAGNVHGMSLEDICLHAPDPDRVLDDFYEWFESLDLPVGKRLVPLAHNWGFERGFLQHWLGHDSMNQLLDGRIADTMVTARYLNDRSFHRNELPPFPSLSLSKVCAVLGVENQGAHDALNDALATAECYRRLLKLGWD